MLITGSTRRVNDNLLQFAQQIIGQSELIYQFANDSAFLPFSGQIRPGTDPAACEENGRAEPIRGLCVAGLV